MKYIEDSQLLHVINLLPLDMKEKDGYYISKCPYHDDHSPSFTIIKQTNEQFSRYIGNFKCWSCGEQGSLNKLTKHLMGKSVYQLLDIRNYESFIFKNSMTIPQEKKRDSFEIKNEITINGELQDVFSDKDCMHYLMDRKVSLEFIEYYDLKYADYVELYNDPQKPIKFSKRLTIPLYYEEKLVNIEGRAIHKVDEKKVIYVKNSSTNFLFDYDNLIKSQPLIVVEGVMDLIRLFDMGYRNISCLFGVNYSSNQVKQLREFNELIIFTDDDEAGEKCLESLDNDLEREFYIARLNVPGLDPGGATIEQIEQALNNKKLSVEYFLDKSGLFFEKELTW